MRPTYLVSLLALSLVACDSSDGEDANSPPTHSWETDPKPTAPPASPDVGCAVDADCAASETCIQGTCQMRRCVGSYSSNPPLGQGKTLIHEDELLVTDGDRYADAYDLSNGGAFSHLGSGWDLQGGVVDVAGGDLLGSRPQAFAAVFSGSSQIVIVQGAQSFGLDVVFAPIAVAAGDVDGDGLDELVAAGAQGDLAICDVEQHQCTGATLSGATVEDVAVGDVDGDGLSDLVILSGNGAAQFITTWNPKTNAASVSTQFNASFGRISAGDLDGDGKAEILAIEDGGYWGWASDKLHVLAGTGGAIVDIGEIDIAGDSQDVATGDINGDGASDAFILRGDATVEVLQAQNGSLVSAGAAAVSTTQSPKRLAVLDADGDSVTARLTKAPTLVAGNVVPVAELLFPPYDKRVAQGASQVILGDQHTTSASASDTIALRVGMTVGFEGGLSELVKAKVAAKVSTEISRTNTVTTSKSVSLRYTVDADPNKYGEDFAAVLLSCGCFHDYVYRIDDPTGLLGGAKVASLTHVLVPIGGDASLWSSRRYAAMAARVGLPAMAVPYPVGALDNWPSPTPVALDGSPVSPVDAVFSEAPVIEASDIARVAFSLNVGSQMTSATATRTALGLSGSIEVAGVSFGVEGEVSDGQGYSITIGSEAQIGGSIPPIPDDPNTMVDEFAANRYAFQPFVYRQHYSDPTGADAGYYVLTYAVSR
jgi:hypothetical protein